MLVINFLFILIGHLWFLLIDVIAYYCTISKTQVSNAVPLPLDVDTTDIGDNCR